MLSTNEPLRWSRSSSPSSVSSSSKSSRCFTLPLPSRSILWRRYLKCLRQSIHSFTTVLHQELIHFSHSSPCRLTIPDKPPFHHACSPSCDRASSSLIAVTFPYNQRY